MLQCRTQRMSFSAIFSSRVLLDRALWSFQRKFFKTYMTNAASGTFQDLHKLRPLASIPCRHLRRDPDMFIPRHKRDKVDPSWSLVYEEQLTFPLQCILSLFNAVMAFGLIERIYELYLKDKIFPTNLERVVESEDIQDTPSEHGNDGQKCPKDSEEKTQPFYATRLQRSDAEKKKNFYVIVSVALLCFIITKMLVQRMISRIYMSPNGEKFIAMIPRYFFGMKQLNFSVKDCIRNDKWFAVKGFYSLRIKSKSYIEFPENFSIPSVRYKLMKDRN